MKHFTDFFVFWRFYDEFSIFFDEIVIRTQFYTLQLIFIQFGRY